MEPAVGPAAGKTTHRCRRPSPHPTHGGGEPSLGRSAHPRRAAEARHRRLGTHGVSVSCQLADHIFTRAGEHFSPTTSTSWRSPRPSCSVAERMKTTVLLAAAGRVAAFWDQTSNRTSAIIDRLFSGLCQCAVRPVSTPTIPKRIEWRASGQRARLPERLSFGRGSSQTE